jgi:hypothetical protein
LLVARHQPENNPDKPVVVRLFAPGFNSEANIFLGKKATKWQEGGDIGGLTTNGALLIMHLEGEFRGGEAKAGTWRELTLGGKWKRIFPH